MFKNVLLFRVKHDGAEVALNALQDAAFAFGFVPCGPTTEQSLGFVAPRTGGDLLVESVNGQLIFKLQKERKRVPASAVKKALEKRCEAFEQETGKKPGAKRKKLLKEEVLLELLPRAFGQLSSQYVWLDMQNRMLCVEASSAKAADDALTLVGQLLAEAGCAASFVHPHTQLSAGSAMTQWLLEDEAPRSFTVDDELELKQLDESGAKVSYSRHSLDLDEIKVHLKQGKTPTKLALTFDGQLSFVLGSDGSLRKLAFIGIDSSGAHPSADAFDAEAALETLTIQRMIPALLEALGGEIQSTQDASSS